MWLIRPRHTEAKETTNDRGLGIMKSDVMHSLDERSDTLICSAGDSPAKTSPSPAPGEGSSMGSDPASSSSSHESLTLFSPMEAGSSLRTFPDFFPPTVDEISPSYSRRWPSSGFTISPGECWIADTSECPSDGAASSSLPDVLEADVPPRFFLSPKAAAGILRRAEKRGRELPQALAEALRELASQHRGGDKRTTRTSIAKAEEPTTTWPKPDTSSQEPSAATPDPAAPTPASSPIPSEPRDSTPQRTAPDGESPSFLSENQRAEVLETPYARQLTKGGGKMGQGYPAIRDGGKVRRLTPTECERLQGFPDGWTWTP